MVSHLLLCKSLVAKTWSLLIFDCTDLVCPQDYFKIKVKIIIRLKAVGFPVLCHCCVFANLRHRWWPGAPLASHQARVDSCLCCRQAPQGSAGRQQVSSTWRQSWQLLPPSPEQPQDGPFPVQDWSWVFMAWCWTRVEESCSQSQGAAPLLLPSCALQIFCEKGPWKSLLLPYSCQSQLRGDTETFMAWDHTLDWKQS